MTNPQPLASGKYLTLVHRNGWEYVTRNHASGVVGIVAVTDENKLLLVEQYRPALGKRVVELPAGLAGDTGATRGEDLAVAAHRELLEETGYAAAGMTYLAEGAASAGLSDEIITLYRATGLSRQGDGGGDESEDIAVHEIPLEEVPAFLAEQTRQGKAIDLKVYAGLYFARQPN